MSSAVASVGRKPCPAVEIAPNWPRPAGWQQVSLDLREGASGHLPFVVLPSLTLRHILTHTQHSVSV